MCLISVKELIKELVFFTISHTDENKDYLILSYLVGVVWRHISRPAASQWRVTAKRVATESVARDVTSCK